MLRDWLNFLYECKIFFFWVLRVFDLWFIFAILMQYLLISFVLIENIFVFYFSIMVTPFCWILMYFSLFEIVDNGVLDRFRLSDTLVVS